MNSVRLIRLQSDYESVRRLVRLHPKIETDGVAGNPPELYRLFLSVRSLQQRGDQMLFVDRHRLEIRLPRGYPRDAPVCRLLTPVFHPNIAPHAVCIGDHWTAAESLDNLIMRVCEMLAFQSYNIKSPLNGEAAQWVEQHIDRVPTDREVFFQDLDDSSTSLADNGSICGNCGDSSSSLTQCSAGHRLCDDCLINCENCQSAKACLVCGLGVCGQCQTHGLVNH
jgi:ubiquitin-protein ligase